MRRSIFDELWECLGFPSRQEDAKVSCEAFYQQLKKLPPDIGLEEWPGAVTPRRHYFWYLDFLVELKLQLMDSDWVGACNKLEDLVQFCPVTRTGIRTPLLALLEEYLSGGGADVSENTN